jgi:hypothetical protein
LLSFSPKSDFNFSSAANRAHPSVTITFTPINHREPVAAVPVESGSIPLGATASEDPTELFRKRTAEYEWKSIEKRPKRANRSQCASSSQMRIPSTPTPTQTSFDSLKVTKPISKFHYNFTTEKINAAVSLISPAALSNPRHDTQVHDFVTTIKQTTPYPAHMPRRPLEPLHIEAAHLSHNFHGQLIREITNDRFTGPLNSSSTPEITFGGNIESEDTATSSHIVKSSGTIALNENDTTHLAKITGIPDISASDEQSDSNDSYPLDDDMVDEDIIRLLADKSGYVQENHIAPSSVQGWDRDSRSATEYDPALQDTPPDLQMDNENATKMEKLGVPEDLLDEDVDWNAVLANANMTQEDPSIDSYSRREVTETIGTDMRERRLGDVGSQFDETGPLRPFVRPPFPQSVRDRPSVPGMSSNALLRTCFRIGVMISQTVRCFNHQQDVVFELYARVTYSNRETLARKQYFQFVDLFKDQQPYPAATLTSWRVGSHLDKDSSLFLDTSGGPRICWCMCKPLRDPKAAIGWTYTVLSIKEVDWDHIRWVKKMICGYSEEQHAEMTTAKV